MPAIDPSSLAGALPTEWSVGPLDQAGIPDPELTLEGPAQPDGFSSVLGEQISKLSELQADAARAAEALATGTATDPAAVVMAVERAQLAMQLAGQLRTKGVEALNDIFHTTV